MYQNELYHHGVKGQRWGVRRFQKIDGSMTPEGKRQAAIKNLRRATKHVYSEGTRAAVTFDKASRAGKNDPIAKYKNSTGYDKHDIAIGKIKESRAILGKETANKIIKSQIARESAKNVATTAAFAAGLTAVRSMTGWGVPIRGLMIGAASTAATTARYSSNTKAYLRDKKLYN